MAKFAGVLPLIDLDLDLELNKRRVDPHLAVIENQMSPSLDLFVPGVLVRLEGEEWWEGVLPGPLHDSLSMFSNHFL